MSAPTFGLYLGDSTTLSIPMTWGGQPFEPGENWDLICTAKASANDDDIEAKFQKTSAGGIEVDGAVAGIEIVGQDTEDLEPTTLVCDVRAEHVTTGAKRVVSQFRLLLARPVTQSTTPSVPIHTTAPPVARLPIVAVTAAEYAALSSEQRNDPGIVWLIIGG